MDAAAQGNPRGPLLRHAPGATGSSSAHVWVKVAKTSSSAARKRRTSAWSRPTRAPTILDQPALLQSQHLIAPRGRARAVRDDHDRPPFALQPLDGPKNRLLGRGSEGAGRLVENKQRAVLVDGASDGEALALPPGDLHAALSDPRVEPSGRCGDQIVQLRQRHRCRAPAPCRLRPLRRYSARPSRPQGRASAGHERRSLAMPGGWVRERDSIDQDFAEAGWSRPISRSTVVVLPAPVGPTSATRDPRANREAQALDTA